MLDLELTLNVRVAAESGWDVPEGGVARAVSCIVRAVSGVVRFVNGTVRFVSSGGVSCFRLLLPERHPIL